MGCEGVTCVEVSGGGGGVAYIEVSGATAPAVVVTYTGGCCDCMNTGVMCCGGAYAYPIGGGGGISTAGIDMPPPAAAK